MGVLSKLDEFLLKPQVRTCSVAAPATSRNINSENEKPTGDRFLNAPCLGVVFSACHNSNIKDSEQEVTHLMVTGVQEEILFCSPVSSSGKQKKRAPQVGHNFAVRTRLRQMKQTRFCWPFNNWGRRAIPPILITTSLESQNCPNPSQRQCPLLPGNQRNSICSKIFSKQV